MTESVMISASPSEAHARATSNAAIRIWLWGTALLVFAMVVVGGSTRLTESGLSITEWHPITGVIPPLSHATWVAEFDKFKEIPQYKVLFSSLDLAGFKFIFFWEWSHRLLGRLIGLVFAVPLIVFWARGALDIALKVKLVAVLALGGLQGFVGWWMVKSGLVGRIEVAQERLALHLILASFTFAALIWIATSLTPRERERALPWQRMLAAFILIVTFAQIFLGGLVAGLRAGRAYNTWPLMDGHFVPTVLTTLTPLWRNFVDNIATVQFDHRITAYGLFALALIQAALTIMLAPATGRRALMFAVVVSLQAALGIVTLLLVVPLWAGLLHQAFAMVVLAFAVVFAQKLAPGHDGRASN